MWSGSREVLLWGLDLGKPVDVSLWKRSSRGGGLMVRGMGLLERGAEVFGSDGLLVPRGRDGCGAYCGGC